MLVLVHRKESSNLDRVLSVGGGKVRTNYRSPIRMTVGRAGFRADRHHSAAAARQINK